MSSARLAVACSVLGTALVATAILNARLQDPTQPTFRADASYVRLDVYPTIDGVPVADLTRDDFEVFEDNRPQTVAAFEHIAIRGGAPQEQRAEPNTVAESRALLQNPRLRAFVIFLDTSHVEVDASHNIRQPLINALDRLIGPDDLVGVMTPRLSAADVTFARRTTTIEGYLSRYWDWGERNRTTVGDPQEQQYQLCYPGLPTQCGDDRGIADAMILRRREKMSLDALDELVRYLGTVREERTAVIAISDGWLLYRPDASLSRRVNTCDSPGQPVGVDPRSGRPVVGRAGPLLDVNVRQCEADRVNLSQLDDAADFQTILNRANRSNVSFYPIDPRGLTVFDTPIDPSRTGLRPRGEPTLTPVAQDAVMLRTRQSTLRDLASATDGIAIMNTNDLDGGFRRITADLSSYYLLGYYSTGKLDGKFHAIRVRVKRPGVQVRARRGYLAPTASEALTLRTSSATPGRPDSTANAAAVSAVSTALASLGSSARDTRLRLAYVLIRPGSSSDQGAVVWAVGEFAPGDEWRAGADVDLTLTSGDGRTIATAHERVAPGSRSFRTLLRSTEPVAGQQYLVRVRATALGGAADAVTETSRLTLPAAGSVGTLVSRRGPSTANREVPTADMRFRRNEQLRVDVPGSSSAASARVLDRTGNALAIPVTATPRTDADGTRWNSATLALAPLAAGDYVIEVTEGIGDTYKTLVAFRVIP